MKLIHFLGKRIGAAAVAALHPCGWNRPNCPDQVKFCPFSRSQFAGPLEYQGGQLQR
jgi:hypothetical protein